MAHRQFDSYKDKVKAVLRGASGQVHFAFDGGRTRNRHTLYGITAFYRGVEQQRQKLVLGLPELMKRHTGENIVAEMLEIIRSVDMMQRYQSIV
jgi:hypothetical protein